MVICINMAGITRSPSINNGHIDTVHTCELFLHCYVCLLSDINKAIQQLKQQQSSDQQEPSSRQEEAKEKTGKDLPHSSSLTPSHKQPEQKTKGQVSLAHKALEVKEVSAVHKGGKIEHVRLTDPAGQVGECSSVPSSSPIQPPSTPRKHKAKSKAEGLATTSPARESHFAGTLDDLCRAAEELERIEKNSVELHHTSLAPDKPRPTPLVLPHERRFNNSPPYTPPPILSPARSITLLAGPITPSTMGITTPNKIMWRQRTGKYSRVEFHEAGFP